MLSLSRIHANPACSLLSSVSKIIKNQYHAEKGNEENRWINEDESRQDCVTRLIREETRLTQHFETVIIDESHFLRNLLAYWGMGKCGMHMLCL